MRGKRLLVAAYLIVVLLLAVVGCSRKGNESRPSDSDSGPRDVSVTQGAAPADRPTASPTSIVLLPDTSAAGEASLDAALVGEVSSLDPGEEFTKIWRIRNTGTVEWNASEGDFAWAFVGGDPMSGPDRVPLAGVVPPGGVYEVATDLKAPAEPGQYVGRWQLRGPSDQSVGPEFDIRINVASAVAEAPRDDSSVGESGTAAAAEASEFLVPAGEQTPATEPTPTVLPAPTPTQPDAPAASDTVTETETPVESQPPSDATPAAPTPTATPTSTPVGLEVGCLDASPVADVTIPDGTVMNPTETYTKIWRIRNSGTCPWDTAQGDYRWIFISGDQMGGPNQVRIASPVPVGGEYDVTLDLTAPSNPGPYEGRWQLFGPTNDPFGVVFWVAIQVSTETPTTGPGGTTPSDSAGLAQQVWQAINGTRDAERLYQLAYSEKLAQAAQIQANDCSQRGSCSHFGSDGSDESDRVRRVGYQGSVDEAWVWSASPADAVGWWLDEVPPNDWHRRLVLSDLFREVGVGVAPAPSGGHYFIAVFGRSGQ